MSTPAQPPNQPPAPTSQQGSPLDSVPLLLIGAIGAAAGVFVAAVTVLLVSKRSKKTKKASKQTQNHKQGT